MAQPILLCDTKGMSNERWLECRMHGPISGDYSSLEKIIDLYMPLIDKSSIVDGQFDEDCKQYILLQVALQIMKFKI